MKNIHILPTDKPSRLIIYSTLLNDLRLLDEPYSDWKHKRHIYITSDKEIKVDGDWIWNSINNTVYQKKIDKISFAYEYKIILTTDQDLIKDGVQAIPDDFLDWFVKNPSCEDVKVTKEDWMLNPDVDFFYKIIIPKEEDTGLLGMTSFDLLKQEAIYDEMAEFDKQETLRHIAKNKGMNINWLNGDEFGAKWQSQRMYSEEEVRQMLWQLGDALFNNCQDGIEEGEPETYFDDIIDQFKKK
jgi:hypothetical protein